MKIKALKSLNHGELGRIEKGAVLEIQSAQLSGIRRFVEILDAGKPKASPGEPLSASPEAQALPQKTLIESDHGGTQRKKRGRKKGLFSLSTTDTE